MIGPVLAFSHPKIEPLCPFEFWAYAMPEVVAIINQLSSEAWMCLVYDLAFEPGRTGVYPEVAAVNQRLVSLVEQSVEMAYTVEGHLVDDQFRVMRFKPLKCSTFVGVDYERAVVKLLHVGVQPFFDTVNVQILGGLEYGFQVLIGGEMAFELSPGLDPLLGVVLRNELLFVLESYPGFLSFEQAHLMVSITALQTVLISFAVRYGCIGSDRTRSHKDAAVRHRLASIPANAV